jgi:CubicO group peptidase (beta-lactamase class C family)
MESTLLESRGTALILAVAFTVAACARSDSGDVAGEQPDTRDRTAVLLDTLPAIMEAADVPGLQLARIESGKLAETAAFGFASAETGSPVTDQTVFEAASLSKPVFAYAVLRMADRGEWALDRPLWETLEYERLAHDERARSVSTRQVLPHTTGLPNWGGTPLEFNSDPGERWNYSGEGFVYLQRAIEKQTGLTLEEIATREVFEPLGMTSSHYAWVDAYDSLAAIPHDELGGTANRRKPGTGNAAASLHTTAAEYARFVVALLQGEGLKPETHEAMLTHAAELTTAGWGDDAEAKANLFWGLGIGLSEGRAGTSFWHWGDQGTARCFVVAYPESGDGLVYFTNSENGLAIGPAILDLAFDDDDWPLRWLDYGRYDDPARMARLGVTRTFLNEGPEAGLTKLDEVSEDYPDMFDEGDMNSLGYTLLRRDAVDEAIAVFERNTIDYPESSNVWDSLGEGLRAAGRLEESIENYEKSIALDPGNENAKRFVREMREELESR